MELVYYTVNFTTAMPDTDYAAVYYYLVKQVLQIQVVHFAGYIKFINATSSVSEFMEPKVLSTGILEDLNVITSVQIFR
jgi:hypothetical protein